jgi:23S rRNA pseudouridine1911/1915/1917 synthase
MEQLSQHSMRRSYLGICVGVPEPGKIETLHGRHPTDRLRFSSKVSSGKRAVTHVEVVERGASWSLVRCRLETGRTHQIRVHLSERCRTPLVADSLYGRSLRGPLEATAKRLGRQALHAAELGFVHPTRGIVVHFESPLPPDLESALERLRALPTE